MTLTIVVPCFNEDGRLDINQFRLLLELVPEIDLLFIDDGSTDNTLKVLRDFAGTEPSRVSTLSLPANNGKAEAVRIGLLFAVTEGSSWAAYVDADLATPVDEIRRLWLICRQSLSTEIVFGSRVRLCGSGIHRHWTRHLVGRIFAFLASRTLGTYVHDTQAGVKFVKSTPALNRALATPFCNRWSFDVELLARLGRLGIFPDRALEVPLHVWHDVPGSKVSLGQGIAATLSLWKVRRRLQSL